MTDQSHTPLLPCPFCGKSATQEYNSLNGWMVNCRYCQAGVRGFDYMEVAQDHWNTRSVNSAPSLVKALEEIASEVGRMVGAVEAVARHQEQCDEDGVMVKVSRQAVDELASAFEFINNASRAALTAYRGEGK